MQGQEHPLQTAGDAIDYQMQAFCREQKEQSQRRPFCSTVLPSQVPFWSSNSSKRAGEKNIPSSVLIFTYRAVLMQCNLTEGGNSISLVPKVSKWSKMASSTDVNFIKGGQAWQEPTRDREASTCNDRK